MTKFYTLLALVALTATAKADLMPGSPLLVDGFELSVSDPTPVGETGDLVSVILSVTNVGTSDNISSFSGSIGADGGLHHEQFAGGAPFFPPVGTPTAAEAANSSVDSHFLPFGTGAAAVNPPSEQTGAPGGGAADDGFEGIVSAEPGDFNVGEFVGFGPALSGDFGFAPTNFATTVDLAQLVLAADGSTDFSFQIGSVTPGVAADFSGTISFIPEPSTALLAGLGLVGFGFRRR